MRKYFAAAVSVLFLASAVISPVAAQDKQAKKPVKTEQATQQKTAKKGTAKTKAAAQSKETKKGEACGETKCSSSCENE